MLLLLVSAYLHKYNEFGNWSYNVAYAGSLGYKAYIQTGYDNSREERTWWKSGELAIARYYGQYECLGGGVWGFLASEDSILVLDKAYWDEYAPMLAGYVILEDNHSLIFCHSTY